jgi:hypothetical protein
MDTRNQFTLWKYPAFFRFPHFATFPQFRNWRTSGKAAQAGLLR